MGFANLEVERRAGFAVVTLRRPEKLNALNAETLAEIERAFDELRTDAAVGGVIVTGSGEKAFVAGADIGELSGQDAVGGREMARRGQRVFDAVERFPKPVIAAINGFALGGGCELAMACTLRLAAEDAKFGQPEVKLGVIAGFGGTQRLPRLVGRGAALKMLLSGAMIPASEALRIGLVDEVLPADKLMARAEELGREIAANAPIALQRTMLSVDYGLDHSLEDGLQEEARHFGHCCATQDKAEGTAAFLEKRAAVWSGK